MDKQQLLKEELHILFDTLCDGLRQEVRQRRLAKLVTGQDFSIPYNEREIGIASCLALHLRSVGFAFSSTRIFQADRGNDVQTSAYGFLPVSSTYILN